MPPLAIDVVALPGLLKPGQLAGRSVIVFDVLRATTTMTAALAAGVSEIRVYASLSEARSAAGAFDGRRILCGERACLPPPGFDLGNSPGAFTAAVHGGLSVFMATTNGTRAIAAALRSQPAHLRIGAIVNAAAVARSLAQDAEPATLLCAGTNGQVAMEDLIGAGAVVDALLEARSMQLESDVARIALRLFRGARGDLRAALADAQGGRNVLAVGLGADIDYAAQLNSLQATVGRVRIDQGVVRVVKESQAAPADGISPS
jgi:2-phosphosulfolactate phosphatase